MASLVDEEKASTMLKEKDAVFGGEDADLKKGGGEEEGEDDDGDEGEGEGDGHEEGAKKKKKKKKSNSKKKKKTLHGTAPAESRLLGGFTDYYTKYGQTNPPTKPVRNLFKGGEFPLGEVQKHGVTKYPCEDGGWQARTTEAERKEKERLERPELYEKVRHAAEVHRQVRRYAQSFIKPGIELADMCARLEDTNRLLMRPAKHSSIQLSPPVFSGCSAIESVLRQASNWIFHEPL